MNTFNHQDSYIIVSKAYMCTATSLSLEILPWREYPNTKPTLLTVSRKLGKYEKKTDYSMGYHAKIPLQPRLEEDLFKSIV